MYLSVLTEEFQVELCTTNGCRCSNSLLLTYPSRTAEWWQRPVMNPF